MKAQEHLARLGEIFTVRQAAISLNTDAKTATVYLDKWKGVGLVKPAGGRSGWWHNLALNPKGSWRASNIMEVFPSATLIGESVLHSAGITTQIPQRLNVAVSQRRTYPTLDGLEVVGKPQRWFVKHLQDIKQPDEATWNTYGMRSLTPAAALLDLYATPGAWHPDPDDLDIDDIREELEKSSQPMPAQLGALDVQSSAVRRRKP